jgi:hypothetical protein
MKVTTNTCQHIWLPKRAANSEPTDYEKKNVDCALQHSKYVQAGALARVFFPEFPYGK